MMLGPIPPPPPDHNADILKLREEFRQYKLYSATQINTLQLSYNAIHKKNQKNEDKIKVLMEGLEFYGNPETYFAIGLFPDSPCGEFMDDFEYVGPELGMKPGKIARKALNEAKDRYG